MRSFSLKGLSFLALFAFACSPDVGSDGIVSSGGGAQGVGTGGTSSGGAGTASGGANATGGAANATGGATMTGTGGDGSGGGPPSAELLFLDDFEDGIDPVWVQEKFGGTGTFEADTTVFKNGASSVKVSGQGFRTMLHLGKATESWDAPTHYRGRSRY